MLRIYHNIVQIYTLIKRIFSVKSSLKNIFKDFIYIHRFSDFPKNDKKVTMLFFYQNFALENFFHVWTEKTFEAQCYPPVHEISVILANLSKRLFGFSQFPIGCLIFMNMSLFSSVLLFIFFSFVVYFLQFCCLFC